jgi:hypothetical protein
MSVIRSVVLPVVASGVVNAGLLHESGIDDDPTIDATDIALFGHEN